MKLFEHIGHIILSYYREMVIYVLMQAYNVCIWTCNLNKQIKYLLYYNMFGRVAMIEFLKLNYLK